MEHTEKTPLSESHANEVGQMVATQNRIIRALFLQPGFDRTAFVASMHTELEGAKVMDPAQPLTVVILTSLIDMLQKLPPAPYGPKPSCSSGREVCAETMSGTLNTVPA